MTETIFENIYLSKKSIGLIHRVYLTTLKNSRKYLASTKIRSEVRGGGKKPWRQKGTGSARAGSIRSPLWVGGGISFGPRPRTVEKKINKKERRMAILSALALKDLKHFDDNFFDNLSSLKTKNIISSLKQFNSKKFTLSEKDKILFILPQRNKKFWLGTRNIKNFTSTTANCLNLIDILKADYIVLTNLSLEIIQSTYRTTNEKNSSLF